MNNIQKSGKYESIQAMRGIAAISVCFQHVIMFGNGAFGVDLFFCISGFIMMYVTEKSGRHFLQKRAVRIIPLYWIGTFVSAVMLIVLPQYFRNTVLTPEYFIKSLLFIPYTCISSNGVESTAVLRVGWTLVCEVFFYIVFFISLKISHKKRHIISSCLLLGIVITAALFGKQIGSDILDYYGQPVMLEFILGMFGYKLLTHKAKSNGKCSLWLIVLAVFIWGLLFSEKYISLPFKIDRLFLCGIPTFIFFLLVFKYFENRKVPRPLIVLGDISFSLYITHTFIVQPFSRLVYNIDTVTPLGVVLVFVAVLPLCIGVAWVSWYLIENKFTGYLRNKLKL
jgi:peptidoglycan/LPS O-acetylase OafA/YrhL